MPFSRTSVGYLGVSMPYDAGCKSWNDRSDYQKNRKAQLEKPDESKVCKKDAAAVGQLRRSERQRAFGDVSALRGGPIF